VLIIVIEFFEMHYQFSRIFGVVKIWEIVNEAFLSFKLYGYERVIVTKK